MEIILFIILGVPLMIFGVVLTVFGRWGAASSYDMEPSSYNPLKQSLLWHTDPPLHHHSD
jgi:hypothetical protein